MFSVINHATLRCAHDTPAIWNKAAYISQYLPWVDIAIGVILCIIGGLASHGVIPMSGAGWLTGIGSAQIIIGTFMNCLPCCKIGYHMAREAYRQRHEGGPGVLAFLRG